MVMARKTARPNPISIYLGTNENRVRRLEHLDALAVYLVGKEPGYRSRFIQALCDGEFDDKLLNSSQRQTAGRDGG